tara:strand:+ start:120 stop:485 length:366 start_codon:yes stop_codon:yes gene_type:complete
MYKHLITIAIAMLSLDIIYLKAISAHFNKLMTNVQGKPITIKYLPVLLCYSLLIFVFYYFIIKDNRSVLDAFLLGFAIYGIYDTTNMATIDNWDWKTVALDTTWGGILFALTHIVTNRILN